MLIFEIMVVWYFIKKNNLCYFLWYFYVTITYWKHSKWRCNKTQKLHTQFWPHTYFPYLYLGFPLIIPWINYTPYSGKYNWREIFWIFCLPLNQSTKSIDNGISNGYNRRETFFHFFFASQLIKSIDLVYKLILRVI